MKKAVISILSGVVGLVVGAETVSKIKTEEYLKMRDMSEKHLELYLMMNQWVKIKQEGKNLAAYFKENGYRKIAIYGMSHVGKTLINELKGTEIEVAYGIDKKINGNCTDINIVSADEVLDNIDVVVVTAITFFDEIEDMLLSKVDCPIIALDDILFEM